MNLYNIKDKSEQVSFAQAVRQGLGREQGLFFPETIAPLADVDALLDLPLAERSARIISHLLGDEVPAAKVSELINAAFTFPAPLVKLKDVRNTASGRIFPATKRSFSSILTTCKTRSKS